MRVVPSGLGALQRDLSKILAQGEAPVVQSLTEDAKRVALDTRKLAAQHYPGGGRNPAAAGGSIRGVKAGVRINARRLPYGLGAEFGSQTYNQFEPWRGSAGYALYPAVAQNVLRIGDKAAKRYIAPLDR